MKSWKVLPPTKVDVQVGRLDGNGPDAGSLLIQDEDSAQLWAADYPAWPPRHSRGISILDWPEPTLDCSSAQPWPSVQWGWDLTYGSGSMDSPKLVLGSSWPTFQLLGALAMAQHGIQCLLQIHPTDISNTKTQLTDGCHVGWHPLPREWFWN